MSFSRKFSPLSLNDINITGEFWANWQRVVIENSLPHQWEQLVATGRIRNFQIAAGQAEGTFEGLYFNDSDVYKWIEAAAYALAVQPDNRRLREMIREAIELIQVAQMADGYLNTFIQIKHPGLQWRNLGSMHEMYCAGHLIEAAVALADNTGELRLLDVAIKFANHILDTFGPGKRVGFCGHEELELAMIRLARTTGEAKYLDFARWQVEMRGHSPHPFETELADPAAAQLAPWMGGLLKHNGKYLGEYAQDHVPIREQTQVVGHAVRAMYLLMAATDLADGQNDEALENAIITMWDSLVQRRMYITGGIGPSSKNEGFTVDFDLPNFTAYAETCASVGLVLWGQRLLEQTGNSDYADLIEKVIFNGALSGISEDGTKFFYDNPLESRANHERTPWFGCACCPPNIARMITNLGALAVGQSPESFFIHQYVGLEATTEWNGVPVKIEVETEFPFSGQVKIRIEPEKPVFFRFCIRIPEFCDTVEIDIEASEESSGYEQGYAVYERIWSPGDVINMDLQMEPTWVQSDPRIVDNLGRVALMVGPVVYCMEGKPGGLSPQRFAVDTSAEIQVEKPGVLIVEGFCDPVESADGLYPPLGLLTTQATVVRFTPYHSWGNRGPVNMQVWVRQAGVVVA